ncbi:hypothetical protein [Caulobacter zeae]|nr:hypothetical protein [Caulobacter zeae]
MPHKQTFAPHRRHPGRSEAESRDPGATRKAVQPQAKGPPAHCRRPLGPG